MKNKLRILLLSATMYLTLGSLFGQGHLAVVGLLNWPDSAHCMVPYNNIGIRIVNRDSSATFSGTIDINIKTDSGVYAILTDTATILSMDSVTFINPFPYFFTSGYYAAGHDVVIVWPVANNIAISDSLTDSVYYDCNAGVPDYKEKKEFSLYPDPANEMLYIKSGYSSNDIDYIRMMDIEGKELNRFSSSLTMIPVNYLERGMYFIEIKLKSGESITSKFVKD